MMDARREPFDIYRYYEARTYVAYAYMISFSIRKLEYLECLGGSRGGGGSSSSSLFAFILGIPIYCHCHPCRAHIALKGILPTHPHLH